MCDTICLIIHIYIESLTAEDDLNKFKTDYKVVKLFNALDILGFEKYMESMGYKKLSKKH